MTGCTCNARAGQPHTADASGLRCALVRVVTPGPEPEAKRMKRSRNARRGGKQTRKGHMS